MNYPVLWFLSFSKHTHTHARKYTCLFFYIPHPPHIHILDAHAYFFIFESTNFVYHNNKRQAARPPSVSRQQNKSTPRPRQENISLDFPYSIRFSFLCTTQAGCRKYLCHCFFLIIIIAYFVVFYCVWRLWISQFSAKILIHFHSHTQHTQQEGIKNLKKCLTRNW